MIMRDGDDRSKTFVAGFKNNCSGVVATFRETYTDGTLFHSENYVFRESANPIHRVTDATVARRSIFLAHSGLGRGNQRANLSTGARVLRHEEVQEAGHRDSRSDRTLHKLP